MDGVGLRIAIYSTSGLRFWFGLGAFAVGIILLTHPEREVQWEQLHIDCAGDEVARDADGDFSRAPYFDFTVDWLRFGRVRIGSADGFYGSASAFSPWL